LTEINPPSEGNLWPPRRVALATLVVLLILAGFYLFFTFRVVFFSLFTAIVLSTAIEPLVDFLSRRGISRVVSVVLISLLVLLGMVALVITLAPLISEQWATITSIITTSYNDLRETLTSSSSLLVRRIGRQLPPNMPMTLPAPNVEQAAGGESLDVVGQALNTATSILRGLLILVAVGLLTNFWILEGPRATRFLLMAIPQARREGYREFLDQMREKVGAYTRGLLILCLMIGAMQLAAYLIMGLPNALLLGILAGIMEAVPIVGPLLGAVPAFVVAAAFAPDKIPWVILSTIIIQALENNLVAPRVMDRAVGVNPVASLLAFVAFSSIFGFTGAVLAIPLAAVIQLILNRVLFNVELVEAVPPAGRDAISTLRYEAQNLALDVRKQVRVKESELTEGTDHMEDSMEAIILDLDSILAQLESENSAENSSGSGSAGAGGAAGGGITSIVGDADRRRAS
jgi:predicted PurR-regulated permease PerM